MTRLGYTLVAGLIGAGVVHLATVLTLPAAFAEHAWEGVRQAVPPDRIVRSPLPVFSPDPFFRLAACRVDLRGGAVRLRASGPVSAWFLSVYAPDGRRLAGLDDRSAAGAAPDLRLVTPIPAPAVGPGDVPSLEVDAGEALLVLEVFVPDASWSAATEAFLSSAECFREPGG